MKHEINPAHFENGQCKKEKSQKHSHYMPEDNISIEMDVHIVIEIGFKLLRWKG
jgi:hypothetical protein